MPEHAITTDPARRTVMPGRRCVQLMLGLLLLVVAALPARAGFEFVLPDSHLSFPLAQMPSSISTGDFSMLTWVWIEAPETPGARTIVQIPNRFEIVVRADGRLAASLLRVAAGVMVDPPDKRFKSPNNSYTDEGHDPPQGNTRNVHAGSGASHGVWLEHLTATTSGPATTGVWTLVGVTHDRKTGKLTIWSRSDGAVARAGSAQRSEWAHFAFLPGDRLTLGSATRDLSFNGLIGLCVIRSELVTSADLDAVFSSRRIFAPHDTDRRNVGGVISGPQKVVWMIGQAMPTFPNNGAGGDTFQRSSVADRPVNKYNVCIYYDPYGFGPDWNRTGPVADAKNVWHRSHNDDRYAGFFVRDRWNLGIGPGWVRGAAPAAAELLLPAPTRPLRVMTSSNSRGVKNGDGSGLSPGNYAHGFIEKFRPLASGILMRPAILTAGANPWFGFDCSSMNPAQSAAGTIIELSATTDPAGDFCRFFTGSAAFGRGPGAGVFLLPNATYSMRCRSESLSLLTFDAPLDVEAYVMAYPGACDLKWRTERGPNLAAAGVFGTWTTTPMDTARITLPPDPIIFQTQSILAFFGDQTTQILPGDACAVTSGPGARGISLVDHTAFDGIRTRVYLQKPLLVAPTSASTVKFGPWELRTISASFAPVSAQDSNKWRGIGFQAGAAGTGTPIFAFSAVRPDVPGYIFGTSGWGGHGYQQQLDASFTVADIAWMKLTKADVWFQVPAQQLSLPSVMTTFTNLLRTALPACDIIWAGESGLFADPAPTWHKYIFDHAAENGVVGLSLLEHPRVGNLHEQYADGMLSDNDHYCQRGNRRLADLWIAQLRQALRTGCPADYDQNGTLDADDLAKFQADLATQNPSADVNADGLVDSADLALFLEQYTQGC